MPMPKKPRRNCLFCQKECNKPEKFYCNNDCQHKLQSKNLIDSGKASIRCKRNYIIETRGRVCEICKGREWLGHPMPVVLDHIDGNSDNNDLSNLRLVCGNCDMQLPTYKSKNRGNGRHFRRERYAAGKSY